MVQTDKKQESYWRKAEIRRWLLYVGLENASKRLLKETVYPFHSLKIWKIPYCCSAVKELQKSGRLFLVTAHYPEVKQYADKKARIENAKMTFDKESLKPLYQLVIGEAGESCAFYIAGKMGMPEEMLKTAMKAAYGKEEISENLKQVVSKNHLEKRRVSGIQKRKRRNEVAPNGQRKDYIGETAYS